MIFGVPIFVFIMGILFCSSFVGLMCLMCAEIFEPNEIMIDDEIKMINNDFNAKK